MSNNNLAILRGPIQKYRDNSQASNGSLPRGIISGSDGAPIDYDRSYTGALTSRDRAQPDILNEWKSFR